MNTKTNNLVRAALNLSTCLIEAEANGLDLPEEVDDAWAELTLAIQEMDSKND